MRDGNLPLVGSASNLIPILSTAIGSAYLGVAFRGELLGGAALVVLGALLSQAVFRNGKKPPSPGESKSGTARRLQ
jgi:drug/metabolite transporter (DMT)-like permease